MSLNDALTDSQPQTGPSHALNDLVLNTIKALKNPLQFLWRDAYSLVADPDEELPLVPTALDGDGPSFRRVLDGIAQEITQHLFNAFGLNCRHQRIRGEIVDKAVLCGLDLHLQLYGFHYLSGQLAHIRGALV